MFKNILKMGTFYSNLKINKIKQQKFRSGRISLERIKKSSNLLYFLGYHLQHFI